MQIPPRPPLLIPLVEVTLLLKCSSGASRLSFHGFLGLSATRTAVRAAQPSMGRVPLALCTEALSTLWAVLGEWGSPWCSPPSPRAGMNAVWAGSVSPSRPCYCSRCPAGSRAGLSQPWSAPLANFCNNPTKTSFVQWVTWFRAASRTTGPSWCGRLSGCWLMLQTCGENKMHQLWPGNIQGCKLNLERLRRVLQMQLCQKAAEISWPGSPPALLTTPGKSVLETPHLQIRF